MGRTAQGRKKIIKRIFQVVLIVVIFYFLAKNLYVNWNKIAEYDWHINYYFLVFSWLLSIGGGFLIALGWNLILRVLGGRLNYKRALKIFFITDLAKYIPGKVWTMVGKVYMCKEEGVPVAVTSTSVVIQPLIQVISGLLIFLLSLPFWTKTSDFINNLYFFFPLIPIGLLFLHPAIMTKPLNFVLRKLKQKPIEIKIKYRDILLILLLWCGLWVLTGITYYFLIISVHPFPLSNLPVTIGIFAIAGVSQFLTPSGIGVLEGMLTVLLGLYFPLPVAILIALLARVWKTISELVCIAITVKF
jgi:uncharacterized membrane protein YbhN (UPF0104 family)